MTVVKEELYDIGDRTYYNVIINHAEVHNDNDDLRKDSARGFSPNRMFQHIGAVPVHVWHAHAKKIGYYEMDKEKRKEEIVRFLNEFRGWSTVESIRTHQPSETNIIVK